MSEILLSERLPVLPLRGMTVFPHMLIHFDVGREKSVTAVEKAMKQNQQLFWSHSVTYWLMNRERTICTRWAPSPGSSRS